MLSVLTQNIARRECSSADGRLYDLKRQEPLVGVDEGAHEAEPGRVEGVEREGHAPAPAVRDVARNGQHQQSTDCTDGADLRATPLLAREAELK